MIGIGNKRFYFIWGSRAEVIKGDSSSRLLSESLVTRTQGGPDGGNLLVKEALERLGQVKGELCWGRFDDGTPLHGPVGEPKEDSAVVF